MKKRGFLLCLFMSGLRLFALQQDYDSLGLPRFIVGTCVHFGQHKGLLSANLNMLRQAGIHSVRDELSWKRYELRKGELKYPEYYRDYIDQTVSAGLIPLNILDFGNRFYDNGSYPRSPDAVEAYCRYTASLVEKLKGKVRLFQVWNEWDGGCGMAPSLHRTGDPESYIRLLKAAAPRIKAIIPEAIVVANSVCTGDAWLEKLLKLGLLNHCDVVALHTYNYRNGQGLDTPEAWHKRMLGVDTMLRSYNNGRAVPLYVTEMGWPNQIDNYGSTYDLSAAYLARLYLLARTLPYIKGVWWYDFQDDGWKYVYNEDNFGLVRPDLTAKPAYYVIADISAIAGKGRFIRRIDTGNPDVWALEFELPEKGKVLVMWSADENSQYQIYLKRAPDTQSPVSVRHAGRKSVTMSWTSRDWPRDRGAKPDNETLTLCLGAMPLIVEGNLKDLRIVGLVAHEFPEKRRPGRSALLLPWRFAKATPSNVSARNYYDFGSDASYCELIPIPRKGRKDFGAEFAVCYDRNKLTLDVKVQDDIFFQDNTIENAWKGDSLQFAIKKYAGASNDRRTEIDIALCNGKTMIFKRQGNNGGGCGLLNRAKGTVTRTNDITYYHIDFPLDELELDPLEPGVMLGFSLLVNDNDGKGRKGYLHWGEGIGGAKDCSRYNLLLMD